MVSYTFRWEDPDPEDRETLVTLSLREIGSASTELAFHQGDFATERRRALHEQGWTQSLNHLEELLAAPAAPGASTQLLARSRPRRPLRYGGGPHGGQASRRQDGLSDSRAVRGDR